MNACVNLSLRSLTGICLILLSTSLMAKSASQSLMDVPVPSGTQLQSVSTGVVQNGQSMAVVTYESSLPLMDTVQYFNQLWKAEPGQEIPGLVENRVGEWLMLGRLQEGKQIVLQLNLATEHRSSGFLSVMKLDANALGSQPNTMLPGLERLSITQSQDGGRASVLSVYSSQQSVPSLTGQFADFWQDKGWTLVSSEVHAQSRVMLLNRDSAQLEIVISAEDSQRTIVVINEVDDV